MISDPAQHVGEPSLWVDLVQLGGLNQGEHRSGALAAPIGASEEPGPAADRDEALIVPPSIKYLGTLGACRRQRRDSGDLFGPPPF
jgi:hypothetical protein